ncbi:Rieske (2Fe-2S) protein [Acuticoccus kandeliae]|uniref:Rieske (2Fe-2S) protein n=1 Tax=Acuticoccus kandeliae TaxID=2073160 RepID=UPI000D3E9E8F|nr:Rieske 2Fe-2S domain-containing protein [Acuticoccus kandeliae]
MSWRDLSSAPPPGTPVCAAEAVTTTKSLLVESERGAFPILLVRAGGRLAAYLNACPHQYLPLDYRAPNLLSADGTRLLCSSHGAAFDAATGEGVDGFGLGCALDRVPVTIDADGMVRIAD